MIMKILHLYGKRIPLEQRGQKRGFREDERIIIGEPPQAQSINKYENYMQIDLLPIVTLRLLLGFCFAGDDGDGAAATVP